MLRSLTLTVVLAVALAAGLAYSLELGPFAPESADGRPKPPSGDTSHPSVELGPLLYPAAPEPPAPVTQRRTRPDPIVISGCHLVVLDKQDVPSQRDGQIILIGEEVFREDPNAPGEMMTVTVMQGGNPVIKTYRRLREGDLVKPEQMVALLDQSLALNEWTAKKAKITAAEADVLAAAATYREAIARLERLDVIRRSGRGSDAVAAEEYSAAMLTRDKYKQEEVSKREAKKLAIIEAEQAEIILKQHEIRSKLPGIGIVKTIYKQRGEAVKSLEPVLQLHSIEHLRAEGLMEVQYFDRLNASMKVSIEPTQQDAPWRVLKGHRGEITSLAVSNNQGNPQVVSASEDQTVCVWDLTQNTYRMLYHPDAVRVVACTPRGCKQNWCLSGSVDGSIRLWDLDSKDSLPKWTMRDQHRGTITALAFSPDGKYFASGGEDNLIYLWKTDSGEVEYAFDAEHGVDNPHQGTITSLHFTPQTRLISASRDNTLRVWKLHQKGAQMEPRVISGRGGNVSSLDVSQDGRFMLFDQGKTLQLLSLPDGRTTSLLQMSGGGTAFETLALFSPDASLILTGGAPEGRLQLWRAPTDGNRGYEVRQWATSERSPVTCAAFAHDAGVAAHGSFAVSGTKDGNVYVWAVPNQELVNQHRIENLRLTLLERALDASTRQVRIGVDVHNPIDAQIPAVRLIPGRPVTVVIEP